MSTIRQPILFAIFEYEVCTRAHRVCLTFFPDVLTFGRQKSSWRCNRSDRKWIDDVYDIRFIEIQFESMFFTATSTSSARASATHFHLNRSKVIRQRFVRFITFAVMHRNSQIQFQLYWRSTEYLQLSGEFFLVGRCVVSDREINKKYSETLEI